MPTPAGLMLERTLIERDIVPEPCAGMALNAVVRGVVRLVLDSAVEVLHGAVKRPGTGQAVGGVGSVGLLEGSGNEGG